MKYGVHLPQIAIDEPDWTLQGLIEYAETAERLEFRYLCANDHLLFSQPWLDGPTALAVLLSHTELTLATTISLPVVRGPVALAKTLSTIDLLSDGRLIVGVGPGSSERDYEAVGIPFEERWSRFDESIRTLRALWDQDRTFEGEFYSTDDIVLKPPPAQQPRPPIWIGSWGSKVGLRRVARLGDGWLASGYNTTPAMFEDGRTRLGTELHDAGEDPNQFPNAIATMFFHVTEDEAEASQLIHDQIAPILGRPPDELAERLLVGPAQKCAELLAAYRTAGVQRVFLWPVKDELEQLRLFREQIVPSVDKASR